MNRLHQVLPILFCLLANYGFSQQLPLFTQYRTNAGIINPASLNGDFFVYEQNVSFSASYRTQWTTLDAAPQTQTIGGEFFQNRRGGFNLLTGGYLINDQTGPTGFTGLYGRIGGIVGDDLRFGGISFALNLGMVQYKVDASELRLREDGDIIAAQDHSQWFPDVGLGVFAYTMLDGGFFDNDYLVGGLSVPQVIGLDLTFENENGEFHTKRIQHIYAMAGLYHFFRDDSFIEVSTWGKYAPNAPFNADVNLRYQMQSNFWAGTGLSTAGTVHFEAGFILGDNVGFDNTFKIGYGFDYSISTFGPYVGPTHELNLSFAMERR